MTVAQQVKTTVASLKSAQANLETFALSTQNQQAKQMYTEAAKTAQTLVDTLEQRVSQIEQEEPTYAGF
ncbi:MAG: DUF1657 domain-containing protein [Alicyclobacillaceae bacterium]|uniref:DUF1657 domain-containing protein n=1 Tax=Alicyclobacillus sp. SP_1 TaxID=2942475 RepID=UPI0021587DA3|nr:DUF1657 domain-containing protein [Alicyclobacillus sp. SP_1]MCY0888154.1 DUF1657 domain-containing protein [Alicyclobacillaceae bacterium]MCY0896502.1 DUF1657 domain-containing protein [Alicyclobacillaceae bacterium]